jgi:hypothetical protein
VVRAQHMINHAAIGSLYTSASSAHSRSRTLLYYVLIPVGAMPLSKIPGKKCAGGCRAVAQTKQAGRQCTKRRARIQRCRLRAIDEYVGKITDEK